MSISQNDAFNTVILTEDPPKSYSDSDPSNLCIDYVSGDS